MTDQQKPYTEKTPLLSVVIPVYNAEKYLADCLDSVLDSGFPALEIICVDDGSSDGSLPILEEYGKKDPRVRILRQEHLYAGAARNAGIAAASGRYIHFLDADDMIAPSAYEKWVRAAEDAGAEVCEALYTNIDADTEATESEPGFLPWDDSVPLTLSAGKEAETSLLRGHVIPWNKLYLRNFLTENGICFDGLVCAEDRSFYFDVIFKARRYVRVEDRFVLHRIRVGTSLDGSDIRLRFFDVEFRSFERIWELAKDQPERVKKQVLDCCINDSFFYYLKAVGTEYEQPIRERICDYWQPWLPLLGSDLRKKNWYLLYVAASGANRSGLFGKVLLLLCRVYQRAASSKGLPALVFRKAAKLLLMLVFSMRRRR